MSLNFALTELRKVKTMMHRLSSKGSRSINL